MSQLVRMHGYGVRGSMPEQNVGNKGIGDTPVSYADTAPSYFQPKTTWVGVLDPSGAPVFQNVRLEPFISNRCNTGWVFDNEVSPPYSFTMEYWRENNSNAASYAPVILFRRYRPDYEAIRTDGPMTTAGSILRWGIYTGSDFAGQPNRSQMCILNASRGVAVATTAAFVQTARYRLECRVLPGTPNPTVRLRTYLSNNPSSLWFELTTSAIPADQFTINALEIGYNTDSFPPSVPGGGIFPAPISNFTDLQFWDEDKTPFGQYDKVASHGVWSFWDGTTERPLDFEGIWNGVDTVVPPEPTNRFLTYPIMQRAQEGGDYLKVTFTTPNVAETGNVGVTYDAFIPQHGRPSRGWPVVMWIHGGFFVGGSRFDIDLQWMQDLIEAGYVVLSPEYRLASIALGTHIEQQVRDCKHALWHFAQRPDVNVDDLWTAGHSAGGHLAIAMHLTRDMADDGSIYHRDMRINGSVGPADVKINGSMTHAAPTNLQYAVQYDVLEGVLPIIGGFMNVNTMFKILYGQTEPFDYSGVVNLDQLVTPQSKPIMFVVGTGDLLVETGPYANGGQFGHEGYIRRAYAANGISSRYTYGQIRSDHDEMDNNYDSKPIPITHNRWNNQIIDWLAAQRAALGLVPV